jgi:putative transposase
MCASASRPPRRSSLRLKNFDYSTAAVYFLTVCTSERKTILGASLEGKVRASAMGRIVSECWFELPYHYAHLELGAFIVMPNHVHGLISLRDPVGAGLRPAPTTATLSEIVGVFKSFSSRRIHAANASSPKKIWQRGYYEHIVRNPEECERIKRYILKNPARWAFDRENPQSQNVEDPDAWEY